MKAKTHEFLSISHSISQIFKKIYLLYTLFIERGREKVDFFYNWPTEWLIDKNSGACDEGKTSKMCSVLNFNFFFLCSIVFHLNKINIHENKNSKGHQTLFIIYFYVQWIKSLCPYQFAIYPYKTRRIKCAGVKLLLIYKVRM